MNIVAGCLTIKVEITSMVSKCDRGDSDRDDGVGVLC